MYFTVLALMIVFYGKATSLIWNIDQSATEKVDADWPSLLITLYTNFTKHYKGLRLPYRAQGMLIVDS